MNFWKRSDFVALNKLWQIKLAESGFFDIEDSRGNLASKDSRTTAFANPGATITFFALLNEYLNASNCISDRDRLILELYADGIYITGKNGIVEQTGWSDRTIRNVITTHKEIFLIRKA